VDVITQILGKKSTNKKFYAHNSESMASNSQFLLANECCEIIGSKIIGGRKSPIAGFLLSNAWLHEPCAMLSAPRAMHHSVS
jgi:hypothetical protein